MDTLNENAKIDKDVLKFFVENFEAISAVSGVSLKSIATVMIVKSSSKEKWQQVALNLLCSE
tara:strand:+ start:374 stop:559 length:186 start_codon:yes stop_codon:yes gene_type:complete